MTEKNLVKDMLDISVASVIAGGTITLLNDVPLSSPIKNATGGLIGVGLIKGISNKLK